MSESLNDAFEALIKAAEGNSLWKSTLLALNNEGSIKDLSKVYKSYLKFNEHEPLFDPLSEKEFLFHVTQVMSAPYLEKTLTTHEIKAEATAQIDRVKSLIEFSKTSPLDFNPNIRSMFYKKYFLVGEFEKNRDAKAYEMVDSLEWLGGIDDFLMQYISYLEGYTNNSSFLFKETKAKAEVKPQVQFIRWVTKEFYELTGSPKYAAAVRFMNRIYECNHSEDFGKSHRFKKGDE